MFMSRFSTTLALAAALISPISLSSVEASDTAATTPPVINTVCPMDGKTIDMATAPTVQVTVGEGAEAKQFRLAMCSAGCCSEFKKDPIEVFKPRFGKFAPGPKTNFK